MPYFRTVNASRAGPKAVGILVPPGNRTLVVIRPRSMPVDLVMIRRGPTGTFGSGFMEASRQTAGLEAQKLAQALQQWAEGGNGEIEIVEAPDGTGYWVHVFVAIFPLIACSRVPGQAYQPIVYATQEEAENTADKLRAILCPPPEANQELYTNLSQFGR